MRRLILISILVSSAVLSSAQDWQAFIDEIVAANSSVQSIGCDFKQTKKSTLLKKSSLSFGRMCFVRPDKLRWEYTSPNVFYFVMDGDKVSVGNEKGELKSDAGRDRMFKGITRLMMNCVSGDGIADSRTFSATATSSDDVIVAELTPVRNEMRQMISKLVLHFSRKAESVIMVELLGQSGDSTTIEFYNIVRK